MQEAQKGQVISFSPMYIYPGSQGLPQGDMPSSSLKRFWVWELAHLEMGCGAITLCAVIQGSLLFIFYAYAARAKA